MSDSGLITFDFIRVFPHKMWISNWSKDKQYPDGFRYKLMSARREPENIVMFIIILQQRSGDKEVLHSSEIQATKFDRFASIFVNGLAKEHNIDFEEQNFSTCRDLTSFDEAAGRFGWKSTEPDTNKISGTE